MKKISPKIQGLMEWDKIGEVNERLDKGESPIQVHKWIVENGYDISHPMIYEYARLRKQAIIQGIQIEQLITPIRNPVLDKRSQPLQRRTDKARTEIEIMDELIQRGYKFIKDNPDIPVPTRLMMDAIGLKNRLTDGSHMGLTSYGIEYLKELEQGKFQVILQVLMTFIPEDKQEEVIQAIEKAEEEYYQTTDFYEEYTKAKSSVK